MILFAVSTAAQTSIDNVKIILLLLFWSSVIHVRKSVRKLKSNCRNVWIVIGMQEQCGATVEQTNGSIYICAPRTNNYLLKV